MNASAANLVGIIGITRRLVQDGVLSEADARAAQTEAAQDKRPIHKYLAENNLVSGAELARALSLEFGLPLFDLSAMDLNQSLATLIPEELANKQQVLPLQRHSGKLFVAIADPANTEALEAVKFVSNSIVEPVIVTKDALRKAIELAYSNRADTLDDSGDDDLINLETVGGDTELIDDTADNRADDTPVVKFVNKQLTDAIRRGASDIHFEPYETESRIRFRTDGILRVVAKAPISLHPRIAARLKVMAALDIAERRVPQDGRIKLNLSKTKQMDFRVSTLPTLFGEKIVLRLLENSAAKLGIEKLGYEPDQMQIYQEALAKPYGMILVTGPTGSGKTVSLYTGLNILNTPEVNISTAEDPVEIRVPGINQVQVSNKKGMTFAAALRSFLRQDPNIIMVGEIRDLETAEIAIKAAQTGHLVLSTLHTNDAPQTITRLMNMGIAPYNITSSVTLVIAQRLARRLHDCKRPMTIPLPSKALLKEGFTQEEINEGITLYEPVGCDECTEGYKGRTGIYQVMPMTEKIQEIILAGGNALEIARAAQESGVRDLRRSALIKVKAGITSLAEINRVSKD
ncbi:type IV-A pilus assembly ATPase PilB [Arenimonas sp.]|jgi:type IV pilus assembly protein PilB|uniref:type IV-A pilus assembly ATPase PilB n=1 Tax=Arenimonas sp. TaxID=1872635 RepID=UPI0037BEEE26